MPLAIMRTIPIRDFRKTDVFSGEVRVISGSRTRRGARWQRGRASCNSPELAEPEAASFVDAGGSATSTKAHAANCETGAGLAKPEADVGERAPKEKKQKQKVNPADKAKAEAREEKKKQEELKAKGSGNAGGSDGGSDDYVLSVWEERASLNGGPNLPNSPSGFVDKVNELISLVRVAEMVLRSPDEKSARGLLEKLLEAKYGKTTRTELSNFLGAGAVPDSEDED